MIDLFVIIVTMAFAGKSVDLIVAWADIELPGVVLVSLGILILATPILLQSPFWIHGRSIGKTFMGLSVVDETTDEPVGYACMISREVLSKWLSLYIVSMPLIWKHTGIHERVTNTKVIMIKKGIKSIDIG